MSGPMQQASESLNESISQGTAGAPEGSPITSGSAPESAGSGAAPSSAQSGELPDIGKYDRFKYGDKEYSRDDLKNAFFRRENYIKKTQELAEQRKGIESDPMVSFEKTLKSESERLGVDPNEIIKADIQEVLRNPARMADFKQIYPARYHAVLDAYLQGGVQRVNPATPQQNQQPPPGLNPAYESRLSTIEARIHNDERQKQAAIYESQVKANEAVLSSTLESLNKKYDFADEDAVLSRAEQMLSQLSPNQVNDPGFKGQWDQMMDKLYKESHKFHMDRAQNYYKGQVTKQKQANKAGKDMGSGGGIPAQAPSRMKLKDVKDHVLSSMGLNNG
jgi:hypothetical protein